MKAKMPKMPTPANPAIAAIAPPTNNQSLLEMGGIFDTGGITNPTAAPNSQKRTLIGGSV